MNTEHDKQILREKLAEVYRNSKNYEVVKQNPKSKRCFIFFSSNSLYYPNTEKKFNDTIIVNNRYEWKRNYPSDAGKIIFVRDIKKQWYFDGINQADNSISKLRDLLKHESDGYDITCVGSSAGGYAAVLFGVLLSADKIFCFSGQFSLDFIIKNQAQLQRNPIIKKHKDNTNYQSYFNLSQIISEHTNNIYYFYPSGCTKDIEQSRFVQNSPYVKHFVFSSRFHGKTCYLINLRKLLSFSNSELQLTFDKFEGTVINPFIFSVHISGLKKTIIYILFQRPQIYMKKFFTRI